MNNICIIGAGITGLSMLLLLQETNTDLSKVVIVDPYFDGGDLARKWTAVQSNTPLSKTVNAIKATCPSAIIPESPYLNTTTKLVDIAHLLRSLAVPALKKVRKIQGVAVKANYKDGQWHIQIAGEKTLEIITKKLILASGSEPKTMDIGIPSIPLEVALDSTRLQYFVKPNDRILVFGTMHSGTLVIKNVVTCGGYVVAYYTSPQPFYWARDDVYDGIKEEAAEVADDIISGKIAVELVPVQDTPKVIRSSHAADWVIYAMGFQPRRSIQLSKDDTPILSNTYNGSTGAFNDLPAIWGFGIAYPNLAPDGIHWDVSVAAFLEHMKPQIPAILTEL